MPYIQVRDPPRLPLPSSTPCGWLRSWRLVVRAMLCPHLPTISPASACARSHHHHRPFPPGPGQCRAQAYQHSNGADRLICFDPALHFTSDSDASIRVRPHGIHAVASAGTYYPTILAFPRLELLMYPISTIAAPYSLYIRFHLSLSTNGVIYSSIASNIPLQSVPSNFVRPYDRKLDSRRFQAKALCGYQAAPGQSEEVSLTKGKILDVLDDSGKGWEVRKACGLEELAPSNYLRKLVTPSFQTEAL